jgi:hypothetical protein
MLASDGGGDNVPLIVGIIVLVLLLVVAGAYIYYRMVLMKEPEPLRRGSMRVLKTDVGGHSTPVASGTGRPVNPLVAAKAKGVNLYYAGPPAPSAGGQLPRKGSLGGSGPPKSQSARLYHQ